MNSLIVGTLLQVRAWCQDSEQASVNSFWYGVAAVGALPATDQDVADRFQSDLNTPYVNILNQNAIWRGVQVQVFDPAPPHRAVTQAVHNNSNPLAGVAGTTAIPRQVCGLGSFSTALPGPANRGRVYFPFPATADDVGNGQPTTSYIARLNFVLGIVNTGVAIVAAGRTATLVRILVHRKNKAGLTPLPTPVTGSTASGFWATQRRRGSFGRANVSPI
jgi:hypothetical protein